ncbi:MAG: hypothetical protein ACLU9S_24470 [Oscillospiraceae bacterium]
MANLSGGVVSMWVERPDGTDVTEDYYGIGSLGTRYFYYFDDAFKASETGKTVYLDLSAHSNGMVQGFGGYWWP